MKKSLAIIGRNLSSDKWDIIYKILDKGVDKGLAYKKYDINSPKQIEIFRSDDKLNKFSGIIYICTTADKVDDNRPYIRININTSSNEIISLLKGLAGSLNNKQEEKIEDIPDQVSGAYVEINNKDILLNKKDILFLEKMNDLMDKFNYQIKEVILSEANI
jgi:hypothetical protein